MKQTLNYLKEEDFKEAIVVPWLRKKKFTILRQHGHGPDEQGKDLVIKDTNGRIGACVIKPKIHGQYSKEGNIEEVRNQVASALQVPFPDYISKKRIKVVFVFVISANKITQSAKESIVESFESDVTFFSGEDILEEYYALPLKLKSVSAKFYFYPKTNDISIIKERFSEFELEVETSGDSNKFGIFNRSHGFGKIDEAILTKEFHDPSAIELDVACIIDFLQTESKRKVLLGIFIYFEEDKIEKIENFFQQYILKIYKDCSLDKELGKISIFLEEEKSENYDKLTKLLKKWQ